MNRKPAHKHPSQKFLAPSAIETGKPLKDLMDARLVGLISVSLKGVYPDFPVRRFKKLATDSLEELALTERAKLIADAMAACLPEDIVVASNIVVSSLGPELDQTEGNGLAPFFYLPHSHFVAKHGSENLEAGLHACYELTKRFTSEFCIRPLLERHRTKTLKQLKKWTKDSNGHVRRLVSEGTRPRLPWSGRLKEFQENPDLAMPLLESLKDDELLYVRRSVANHLGDIMKDHLEFGLDVCEKWQKEAERKSFSDEKRAARYWLIRHAVRHPAKNGNTRAIELRQRAK